MEPPFDGHGMEQTNHDAKGRFTKGNGYGGRGVGARAQFSEKFAQDFAEIWEEHGREALLYVAKEKPLELVKAAVGFLPKTVDLELQTNVPVVLDYRGFEGHIGWLNDPDAELIEQSENVENIPPAEYTYYDNPEDESIPVGRLTEPHKDKPSRESALPVHGSAPMTTYTEDD